ncbi:hypothetical protein LguiA_012975 [Lonicera macranthoides]
MVNEGNSIDNEQQALRSPRIRKYRFCLVLKGQDSIAPVTAKMVEILSPQKRIFTFQMWEDHHAVQIFFECD